MGKVIRRTVLVAVLAVTAVFGFGNAISTASQSTVRSSLTILAPAAPGGGWDGFSRTTQQALRSEGVVANVQVVNVPGAAGTIGLAQFVQMEGRNDILMATGGVMVGGISVSKPKESFDDVTLIARVADDYTALVVPASSDIETLEEFIEVWKADPTGTSFAGGSLGSIDHLVTGLLAREIGIDPVMANYIAYSGGGEALGAMLSGTTTAGMSGYNEVAGQIESGELRLLAISAPEPVEGIDATTFVEAGYDVTMTNWRGYVAPPGISDAERQELLDILTEMHDTEAWTEALERNSWTDSWLTGPEFEEFVRSEQEDADSIVKELGL
ncbi:Bug family tripartite tricarboxylate transporter substrate binding protein [Leucobacter tenebrionis]|uniref:Bug family tripartite tricarboxylate transporter substrate binding protein n=1 Tax=Leucobacter tenebrionis TaxID=2873270 RepID=UPI001CA73A0E|nr:tripartite tricarboxylate transporter substrate-binding protein [Leucobacter tenebrionis]QZY51146.1 tripartite tricarboxylate transporter substrate binding protein [Leucobacter tenebrionis]